MSITLKYPQTMSINGTTIEGVIPGYTTLEVKGREPYDREITTILIKTQDGERFRRRRLNKRTLTVRFLLEASTPTQNMVLYEHLNSLLDFEEAKLIFADEPDKYYVGTSAKATMDYINAAVSTGTITIQCSDPYKYKTTENTVTASNGSASFNYDGTIPAYPVLEITAASNLGFIGIADESGNMIQIGDPLEEGANGTDSFDAEKSTTNVTASPPSSWTTNSLGTLASSGNTHSQTGTVNTGTIEGATAVKTNSYGSGSKWHGPSLCYTISAPAVNATLSWKHLCYAANNNQLGNFHAELQTASGEPIAAVAIYRNTKGSKTAKVDMYIAGSRKKSFSFTMSKTNDISGTNGGVSSIDKFGDTITFKIGPKVFTLTDSSIADLTVGKVGFWFGKWSSTTALAQNCLYSATVISHSTQVETYAQVPNKFQTGDVITVDCGEGMVYLNGVPSEGLGALGNDYETFTLTPGANTIGFACSDWASSAPTYKVKYREAYI